MEHNDQSYMALALQKARDATVTGDVPVGAVIVRDGEVIAAACNRREADSLATAHAELLCVEHYVANIRRTSEALRWIFNEDTNIGDVSPLYECGDNDHMLVVILSGVNEKVICPGTTSR